MRKFIASTIMVGVLTGAILFLLSSCAYFTGQDFHTDRSSESPGTVVFKKIETNPVDAESHYLMGCNFQKRKKHDWAIEEFQAAIRKHPGYAEAYNRLGVSYDLIGDFDQAVAAYTSALHINADLDYVHNNLGYSYLLQGRYDLAVASFQQAISLNPEKERYRNNLASAYAKTGQEDAAMATLRAGNEEAKVHMNMAQIYYRDGEYEKAQAYFAKAGRLKPQDEETQRGLTAAASLADIHDRRTTHRESPRPEPVAESSMPVPNRYDADGFYTVPAVPVQAVDNDEIVVVDIPPSELVGEIETTETPFTLAAMTPVVSAPVDKEVARGILETAHPRILDEAEVRDLLGDHSTPGSNKRLKIEVSNGNGVRRMAKKVGGYLNDRGFMLMYLANADHFNYDKSCISYTRGNLDEAYRMSQEIPGLQSLEEVAAIRNGNADISILIGKDLENHLGLFERN